MLLRLVLSVCPLFFCDFLDLLHSSPPSIAAICVCENAMLFESLASVNVSKVNDHESLLTFYIGICIHFTLLYLVGNFKSLEFVAFFTTSMLYVLALNQLKFVAECCGSKNLFSLQLAACE